MIRDAGDRTLDFQLFPPRARRILKQITITETGGGNASITPYHGEDTGGERLCSPITLSTGQSARVEIGGPFGTRIDNGLFVAVSSGQVDIVAHWSDATLPGETVPDDDPSLEPEIDGV